MYRSQAISDDKIAICCFSVKEARAMRDWLNEIGWKSCDGNPFNESWYDAVVNSRLCDLKRGKRGSLEFYKKNNYAVYSFFDLKEDVGFNF
ncbi:MAG: hypothetical protein RR744_00405 [Cellulosilyticaceae bacterium]